MEMDDAAGEEEEAMVTGQKTDGQVRTTADVRPKFD